MNQETGLDTLTYSALRSFKNCRRSYYWRNVRQIVPNERDEDAATLGLGHLVHECLRLWHGRNEDDAPEKAIKAALGIIDAACPLRDADDKQRRIGHLARAMFLGYVARYPEEEFQIIGVETEFRCPIINPATGAASKTFEMRGKADAVIRCGDEIFLMEHKTASQISADYLERLPMDRQIAIYSHYLVAAGVVPRVDGVLYNILGKAGIKQGAGESEGEFQERRAALIAKSKSGTTKAQRKMPESDVEFKERLTEKYREDEMFHRERLYISKDQIEETLSEIWQLTQQLLVARRTGGWYQNDDFCFSYHRPCRFWPICRSNNNPVTIENLYHHEAPHGELSADG